MIPTPDDGADAADAAAPRDVLTRRLHPAFIAIAAVQALGQLLVPLVVGLVGTGGLSAWSLGAGVLGVLGAAVVGVVRWRTVRYRVSGGALRVRRGLVSPDERVVPASRIAALDVQRGLLQRAFGVVGLQARTAGGGRKAEIRLEALDAGALAELRRALESPEPGSPADAVDADPRATAAVVPTDGPATAGAPAPPPAFVLGRRRLVLAAATSPAIGLVGSGVAALGGVLSQSGDEGGLALVRALYDRLDPAAAGATLVVGLAVGFAVLTWILAFVLELVRLAGFRLTRERHRLRIAHGLVPERRATVPLDRVRAVRIVEGVLRQPLGLAEVRLEIAGYAKDDASTQLLLPLVDREELGALLYAVLPALPLPAGAPPRPPVRALRRAVVRRVGLALVPAAAIALLAPGATAALAALPLLVAAAHGWATWRAAGADLHGEVLRLRRRRLARTTLVADARRLQRVEVAATPLQRRARLRSFAVRVASARGFGVVDLDVRTADLLLAEVRALAPDVAAARARDRATGVA